ncbi:MAG TPA: acyl-CoA dehydrogenase family protein [Streptosporangiaceae bacterium]|nr:acyl-CoA dehydrogenase family protein [Streptosporangiaceae bacterium]
MRTAEQEQFVASLHDALAAADVPGAARRWAAGDHAPGQALWRKLAGLGVTALAVPQHWGGLGASLQDVAVACEELGHHALPGPVPESVAAVPVLLATLAQQSGADESAAAQSLATRSPAAQWLPGLATGEQIATLAWPPRLPYAVDADAAGLILLADGDVLRLATAVARHPSVDPARWLWQTCAGQELARGPAAAAAAARALEAGTLACAAQLLGAGRALLEASVRQATQRSQFGQPIGSFQAVKHHVADVAIGLEFARPLLDAAAAALDDQAEADPAPGAAGADSSVHSARDVSAAKIACTDAAYRAARVALQVHGAIGYTQEHDLHLWLTKVRALAGAWGSQAEHRARVMAALARPVAWT